MSGRVGVVSLLRNVAGRTQAIRANPPLRFFVALSAAAPALAVLWWAALLLRGVLPVALMIAIGALAGAVAAGSDPTPGLVGLSAALFVLLVLGPAHDALGAELGDRASAWLYEQLMTAADAPAGVAHLEDPRLKEDLTVARDFDTGMMGPPLFFTLPVIGNGLVAFVLGLTAAGVLATWSWWSAAVLLVAWLSTHGFLRRSAVWQGRESPEVRSAHRQADYSYRLAVEPPAAKEVRVFGLGDWAVDRFVAARTFLHDAEYRGTRLGSWLLVLATAVVLSANIVVIGALVADVLTATVGVSEAVVVAQTAIGVNAVAFASLSWAMDGAAAPVVAMRRLGPAMAAAGTLINPPSSTGPGSSPIPRVAARPAAGPATEPADVTSAPSIRLRDVHFSYPGAESPTLRGFDLEIPAGSSLAIVGLNGAGKTTIAKLLCRLYDPDAGRIEVDGVDLRDIDLTSWRRGIAAAFQDYLRLELSLRDNVAPRGAPEADVRAALADAGADPGIDLETPLAKGYPGGIDLSGGQWQRVALARVLSSVRTGARVVLLDEPTAQLDARGEGEVFERLLATTRHCTTVIVSHRLSTVRHADRICLLQHGQVVQLGTHDELLEAGGPYATMFRLQARRFGAFVDEQGALLDSLR